MAGMGRQGQTLQVRGRQGKAREGLARQDGRDWGVKAQQGGVGKAKQGKAREELIRQGSGGVGKEWCRGKADTAPTASLQLLESSDAFLWQGKELVETQQLLSASLLHKKNM